MTAQAICVYRLHWMRLFRQFLVATKSIPSYFPSMHAIKKNVRFLLDYIPKRSEFSNQAAIPKLSFYIGLQDPKKNHNNSITNHDDNLHTSHNESKIPIRYAKTLHTNNFLPLCFAKKLEIIRYSYFDLKSFMISLQSFASCKALHGAIEARSENRHKNVFPWSNDPFNCNKQKIILQKGLFHASNAQLRSKHLLTCHGLHTQAGPKLKGRKFLINPVDWNPTSPPSGDETKTIETKQKKNLDVAKCDTSWKDVDISVWWDFENCGVPKEIEKYYVSSNITSGLRNSGFRGPVSIHGYGDTIQLSRKVQEALTSTGISLHHVPSGRKDSSDMAILVDLMLWTIDHPPPAHVLLISGDGDFANVLHKLKMKNYNILLACLAGQAVSPGLLAAASSVWKWSSLVRGEGLQESVVFDYVKVSTASPPTVSPASSPPVVSPGKPRAPSPKHTFGGQTIGKAVVVPKDQTKTMRLFQELEHSAASGDTHGQEGLAHSAPDDLSSTHSNWTSKLEALASTLRGLVENEHRQVIAERERCKASIFLWQGQLDELRRDASTRLSQIGQMLQGTECRLSQVESEQHHLLADIGNWEEFWYPRPRDIAVAEDETRDEAHMKEQFRKFAQNLSVAKWKT